MLGTILFHLNFTKRIPLVEVLFHSLLVVFLAELQCTLWPLIICWVVVGVVLEIVAMSEDKLWHRRKWQIQRIYTQDEATKNSSNRLFCANWQLRESQLYNRRHFQILRENISRKVSLRFGQVIICVKYRCIFFRFVTLVSGLRPDSLENTQYYYYNCHVYIRQVCLHHIDNYALLLRKCTENRDDSYSVIYFSLRLKQEAIYAPVWHIGDINIGDAVKRIVFILHVARA